MKCLDALGLPAQFFKLHSAISRPFVPKSLFSDEANATAPEPELNPILPIESSYSLSPSPTPTHPKPVTKCLQQRSFLQTTRSSVRNSLLRRFHPSQCFPPRFFVPNEPFWLRSSLLPSLLRIHVTPVPCCSRRRKRGHLGCHSIAKYCTRYVTHRNP